MMMWVQTCHKTCLPSTSFFEIASKQETTLLRSLMVPQRSSTRKVKCRSSDNGGNGERKSERRSFLSMEEAGLVEISGLSSHERFLCRLTISSLNLLRVISDQEGCSIEELNAGMVCDWFLKDKLKREQNIESAVLQWDDSEFLL